MFNLTRGRIFKAKGGIFCNSYCGPVFKAEDGDTDLYAVSPFNGDNKCVSYANLPGYSIGIEGGMNMLTNKKDGNFTITEIEVWEILNVENLPFEVKKSASNSKNQ